MKKNQKNQKSILEISTDLENQKFGLTINQEDFHQSLPQDLEYLEGLEYMELSQNLLDLIALREVLRKIKTQDIKNLEIHTDSKYLIEAGKKWILKWRKNQWKTKQGNPVCYLEIWQEINQELQKYKIRWILKNK